MNVRVNFYHKICNERVFMKNILKFSFVKTLPVLCGYLFLGIAFGILLEDAGYGALWSAAISIFIYAGSMQYALVGFISGGVPLLSAAVMTLVINSRHIFYGLTFVDSFKKMGRACLYMIFSLTDETYSILCSMETPKELDEEKAMLAVAVMNQIYWVLGSVIGSLVGGAIAFDTTGIDFAMTALFVVIFIEQWLSFKTHAPAVLGIVSGVVCLAAFGSGSFILPSLIVTVTGLMLMRERLLAKMEVGA